MRMRFLRLLRAVIWSFIGVRRGADAARDIEAARPAAIVVIGVLVAATLVIGIAALVHGIVGRRPMPEATLPSAVAPVESVRSVKHSGPVVVADTMDERVRSCTHCHGSRTEATRDGFSPRIAGKPAGYLFNQLVSFRDGRRAYGPMAYLVQYMSDDYLREMASYFSTLDLPYAPPESLTLTADAGARVKQLVEHGDSARDIPACSTCHGASLTGAQPAIPGLLGLPRHYLTAQFGAWRNGRLRSVAPDCMAQVAQRLAPDDVAALAAWLAAQPVPPGMHPAPASTRPLPLECGSVRAATRHETAMPSAGVKRDDAGRGRELVIAGDCIACHTAKGEPPFAGGRAIDTPFGTVYSTNITPDVATGIGSWSRDEFRRALHEGRSKDGRLLYPAFPYPNFTRIAAEDADAMFEYLRTVRPASRTNTAHALRFPYSTQAALGIWRTFFFRPGRFDPDPARSAEWNRGAYLVQGLGHCDACHAARNALGAVSHTLDLGGGLIPMQNWYAPPLVSSSGAGVAGWTTQDIEALLRTGVSQRAAAMGPMAEVVYRSTQQLAVDDTRAIATYLQSFAHERRVAQPAPERDHAQLARGAVIYDDHCAECHGSNGEGALPAYPALAGNPSLTEAVPANAIKAVLHGGYPPVTAGNPRPYGMPPFFDRLNDLDVAAVVTYMRASWGNAAGRVTTIDVERYR
jgi:cytochrome c553